MPFDFTKLGSSPPEQSETDPMKLLRSLRITDPNFNDIWLGQGDALRDWHENRLLNDVAINLTTGAGKTLVGLLAAQSLVNETRGPVVYLCASKQLVHQTALKAAAYGLPVCTYTESNYTNKALFQEGRAPCLTVYQSIFNGLTRKWDDVRAIIFDDAHAATHIIREQFTLKIERDQHPHVYTAVANAFSQHLRETDSDMGFRDALSRKDPASRWFVPPFVIRRNRGNIDQALLEARLDQHSEQMFRWGYLKDRIDVCASFITPFAVYFTPPSVPVRTLPYFGRSVRRVYLSATLSSDDVFIRTFGKAPDRVIAPPTPAGQCERMILVPAESPDASDELETTKKLVAQHKTLIVVPSRHHEAEWRDILTPTPHVALPEQVEAFKTATSPEKLCLVARYDGVDLPGATCRVMVIHDLPAGLGPLERFMWEQLRIHRVLRTTVASRITQSFGRITRGLSDHGTIILLGKSLIDWLLAPANRAALPPFLRKQLEIGFEISRNACTEELAELIHSCLTREERWTDYHGTQTAPLRGQGEERGGAGSPEIAAASAEMEFGHHLWHREYEDAIRVLNQSRQTFCDVGSGLGAWYILWEAYLHEVIGRETEAFELYSDARRLDRSMPNVVRDEDAAPSDPDDDQISEATRLIRANPKTIVQKFDHDTELIGEGTPAQAEETVRKLGIYLGLHSSRPDNDNGTGPDVLWHLPGRKAWSFELKTKKQEGGSYSKSDIMQAEDHVRWVSENQNVDACVPFLVGPRLPPDRRGNPSPNLMVLTVEELKNIRLRVRAALVSIAGSYTSVTLRASVAKAFEENGLRWTQLSSIPPGQPLKG